MDPTPTTNGSSQYSVDQLNAQQRAVCDQIIALLTTNGSSQYSVDKLTAQQRAVYDQIFTLLTSDVDPDTGEIIKPKVITLDAPPGTGKTHLIITLAHDDNLNLPMQVIAFSNALVDKFRENNVISCTLFKYLRDIFSFQGRYAEECFDSCSKNFGDCDTLERYLYQTYENVRAMLISTDILILDEYSVPSPGVLLCLALAGRRLKKHIIFMGDGDQLNCIEKSKFHKQTNRSLAAALSDQVLTLDEQMRILDPAYNKMLIEMKSKFHPCKETPLTFDIIFCIYTHFKDKFFTDSLEATFLTGYHNNISNRKSIIKRAGCRMPPLLTYHSVIGSTIGNESMVLDMSNQEDAEKAHSLNANSIYVGLSRLRTSDQLAGLRYPHTLSLLYTQLVNDEYYYYLKTFSKDWRDQMYELYSNDVTELPPHLRICPVYNVRDPNAFSHMPVNCRILRSAFNRKTYGVTKPTSLMRMAEFFRHSDTLWQKLHSEDGLCEYYRKYLLEDNGKISIEPPTKRQRC